MISDLIVSYLSIFKVRYWRGFRDAVDDDVVVVVVVVGPSYFFSVQCHKKKPNIARGALLRLDQPTTVLATDISRYTMSTP